MSYYSKFLWSLTIIATFNCFGMNESAELEKARAEQVLDREQRQLQHKRLAKMRVAMEKRLANKSSNNANVTQLLNNAQNGSFFEKLDYKNIGLTCLGMTMIFIIWLSYLSNPEENSFLLTCNPMYPLCL